jgi:hypothetical protein
MVSTLRLNLLRVVYFLIFLFTATEFWPRILLHRTPPTLMTGVSWCFFAALTPLMLLALRHPLKMLPVMMFELLWKSIWFFGIGLPLWLSHQVTADNWETIKATLMGVILCPAVIPWDYVVRTWVKAPGERWIRGGAGRTSGTADLPETR